MFAWATLRTNDVTTETCRKRGPDRADTLAPSVFVTRPAMAVAPSPRCKCALICPISNGVSRAMPRDSPRALGRGSLGPNARRMTGWEAYHPPEKKLDESRHWDFRYSWDRREVARRPSGQIRALLRYEISLGPSWNRLEVMVGARGHMGLSSGHGVMLGSS